MINFVCVNDEDGERLLGSELQVVMAEGGHGIWKYIPSDGDDSNGREIYYAMTDGEAFRIERNTRGGYRIEHRTSVNFSKSAMFESVRGIFKMNFAK